MPTVNNQQIIAALYVATYDRAPDNNGLAYWVGQIPAGQTPFQVSSSLAAGFAANPIFAQTYGSLNDSQFVNALYQNILGAPGDAKGVAYWIQELTPTSFGGAGLTRTALLGKFVYDSLTIDLTTKPPGLTDSEWTTAIGRQNLLLNKVSVGLQFASLLGSSTNMDPHTNVSTIAGLNSDPAFVASQAVLKSVTSDPGSVTAAINLLNAAKASGSPISYVNTNAPAFPAPQSSFLLTQNTDVVTGSNVAVTGYTTAFGVQGTYNSGDQITPVGTGNTLTVNDNQPLLYTPGVWFATDLPGATVSNVQTVTFNSTEVVVADTLNSSLGFSGLTQLNVNSQSGAGTYYYDGNYYANADLITAAATTAVNLNDVVVSGFSAGGGLTVNGGSTVVINESNGKFANGGIITVNGGTGTTSVTVGQTEVKGYASQAVVINDLTEGKVDKAGTITTVKLDGLAGGAPQYGESVNAGLQFLTNVINSDVLSNLTVTNSQGYLYLDNKLHNTNSTTVLNLTVSKDVGFTIEDSWNNYQTLNVTTGAKGSTVGFSNFTSVTSETVSGSSVLTQDSTLGLDSLKTITVSGGAGFISDLSGLSKLTSVTADSTSTGLVGVALNAQKTSFTGSAGQDAVLISNDATKVIKAGSAKGNEIVLNNNVSAFSQTYTGANVQGFTTLGVANGSSGTFALSGLTALFSGINAVDVITQTAGDVTFTGASQATTLTFDGYNGSNYYNVVFQTADTTGATDSLTINLGISVAYAASLGTSLVSATDSGFQAANILTLSDSTHVGIANLTINSNTIALGNHGTYSTVNAGGYNSINTLDDAGLASLHLTGTGGFSTNNFALSSPTLTLTDDGTSQWGIYIDGLTAQNLTTINFAGSNVNSLIKVGGSSQIDNLALGTTTLTVNDSFAGDAYINGLWTTATHTVDPTAETPVVLQDYLTSLTLINTSPKGLLEVTAVQDNNLSSLTLTGKVIYDSVLGNVNGYVFGSMGSAWGFDTVTTGITVSGATDNAAVWFWTANNGGANADGLNPTAVDNITLGNGNNNIADGGLGTVNITLGSGSNHVWAYNFIYGGGNPSNDVYTSGNDTIKLGTHDVSATDVVGVGATQSYNTTTGVTVGYSVIENTDGISSGFNTTSTSNDQLVFAADNGVGGATGSVNVLTGTFTNINDWFAAAETLAVANVHQIEAFGFGGNTYLVESNNNFGVTVVELVGVSTTTAAHFAAANGTLAVHV